MFASLFTLAALAASVAAQITINTPSGATGAIQCEAYQITWTGGTGPFDIRLLDAGQNTIEEIDGSATSSPIQWTVNQAAGGTFLFSIHDSTGATASSGQFTVQTSSNTGCLGASASGASSAPAGSSATSAAASTTGTAASTASVSVSSAASSAASSASRPAGSSSTAPARSSAVSGASSAAASAASAASSSTQTSGAFMSASPAGFLGAFVAGILALAA